MPTIGTSTGSSTPSEPAGIGPSTRTARTPAAASSRTTSGVVGPVGSSAAVPATRLYPASSNSGSSAFPSVTATTCRRGSAATGAVTTPVGGTAPPSGVSPDAKTRRPERRRTCTVGLRRRESAAATPSAPAAPPGAATLPNPGPAAPSFPAGATTSVSRARAPSDAVCSGASGKEANGSTTPTSAIRTASWASPSPFGSTAASRPASTWSVRPYTDTPPSESGCQPATRIGRIDAPGATPWIPAGPRTPATRPASSVPWRSGRPG